jgi:Fur family ferric uptake transcriptional regulator
VTPQRVAVADVVLGAGRHLSAEEVAQEARARGTRVGTATVYRALDTLVESGLVVARDFGEGFRRFEAAGEMPHHEHLICSVCGRVEEFRDERLERMTNTLAEAHGFTRQRHRLVIHGVCDRCRRG